ncbi:TolC family protein [Occallatibacter savannae]|uniref:TolC family protein n=1 Tax=Occallatibacter savannae TaxID=1002691 RepID=UPI000D68A4D0|nr:TolC family protein [Occallatibacter savannae]
MNFGLHIGIPLLFGVFTAAASAQTISKEDVLGSLPIFFSQPAQAGSAAMPLTLEETERIALESNPEIAVAVRRLDLARAHVPVARALDDPMAMYRGWGVPLKRPWDYNAAQNMFSISQSYTAKSKRNLRTSLAESDGDQAKANLDAVRLDLRVRVRKSFFDLLVSEEQARVHAQHVALAQQAMAAARIKYTAGNVPQQDVLKAQVALTQLAEHMIHFDRDAEVARARLNTLLGRNPESPIEVRGDNAVESPLPSIGALESAAMSTRPDLAAARAAAERSHKEQTLAAKAYIPDFTLSAGYMLMPSGQDFRNAYMLEGTMNLPWLNRKRHDAEIAEARIKATEQDAELTALQNSAHGQIAEALAEARSAQKLALLYQHQLKTQAEATLQSSLIAYENNKTGFLDLLDSQMRVVDVDLAWAQAVGEFDARRADLEMAIGGPIDQLGQVSPEVK